jgi:hypothetical protein
MWLFHLHNHKPENLPFVDPPGGRLPQDTTNVDRIPPCGQPLSGWPFIVVSL